MNTKRDLASNEEVLRIKNWKGKHDIRGDVKKESNRSNNRVTISNKRNIDAYPLVGTGGGGKIFKKILPRN